MRHTAAGARRGDNLFVVSGAAQVRLFIQRFSAQEGDLFIQVDNGTILDAVVGRFAISMSIHLLTRQEETLIFD